MKDVRLATKQLGDRAWLVYLALGAIAVGGDSVVPVGAPQAALYSGIGLSAVVVLAVAPKLHHLEHRRPWYLFAAGFAAFVAGDVVSSIYELTGDGTAPFPSSADILYLSGYPLVVAAVALIVRRVGRTYGREGLVDAAIVACAASTIAWEPLVRGFHSQLDVSTLGRGVLVAYVVGDLVVLAAMARLIVGVVRVPTVSMLAVAGVLLLGSDVLYQGSVGLFVSGRDLIDLGYLSSYVLWGVAALHPSVRSLGHPVAVERRSMRSTFVLLVVASVTVPGVLLFELVAGGGIGLGQLVFSMALIAFAFVRLGMSLVHIERARVESDHARQRLAESEARFRTLTESAFDIVSMHDAEGTIVYESPAITRALGYTPDQLVGTSAYDLLHPDDLTAVAEAMADGVETPGAAAQMAFRLRHEDGSWRMFDAIGVNLLNDPDVGAVVVTSRDVTERWLAEDAGRRSDARYRALLEQSFDAVTVLGADGVVSYASRAIEQILGYTPAEFTGLDHRSLIHPDDVAATLGLVGESAQVPGSTVEIEYRLRHKDGSWRTVASTGKNLLDDPAVSGFLVTMRDVTEQRRAEAALAESEERFRATFENAPMGIAIAGLDGTFLRVNRAFGDIAGYSADELAGRSFADFVFAEELESGADDFRRLGEDGGLQTTSERRVRAKDGSERWVQSDVSALLDAAGAPTGFVIQAIDWTDKKRAEADREDAHALVRKQNELLKETDSVKDELISVVSHDLRTPLTSIMGYLELVLDDAEGTLTAEQRSFLDVIDRNANRLLTLVNELLFIARAESGRLELELTEVDVVEVAGEVVEGQRLTAARAGVDLLVVAEGAAPAIADRARVSELLENLVSNAIKFTPAGGTIEVRASTEDGVAILEVADTGVGLSESDQAHLFERFFRSRDAHKVPGIGLGLSIVKAIVTAHGGEIAVTSRLGEGTTFLIELPRVGAAVLAPAVV
jgi:PAS domain S-box-containing protein